MDRAAAAHGKLDTCVELSGDDNKMKAKVSIVRTDPFKVALHEFNHCCRGSDGETDTMQPGWEGTGGLFGLIK